MNLKYRERCEDTEQALFIQWCNRHEDIYPLLHYIHHIPNGGKRDPKEAGSLNRWKIPVIKPFDLFRNIYHRTVV